MTVLLIYKGALPLTLQRESALDILQKYFEDKRLGITNCRWHHKASGDNANEQRKPSVMFSASVLLSSIDERSLMESPLLIQIAAYDVILTLGTRNSSDCDELRIDCAIPGLAN